MPYKIQFLHSMMHNEQQQQRIIHINETITLKNYSPYSEKKTEPKNYTSKYISGINLLWILIITLCIYLP